MTTLVLRLSGPLQAWPAPASFDRRPTRPYPTWSALIGFFHACLGVPRPGRGQSFAVHPAVAEANLLIRCDQMGTVLDDYHTINPLPARILHGDPKAKEADLAQINNMSGGTWRMPKQDRLPTALTTRGYLTDATFCVLIAPHADRLDELTQAIRHPLFSPYLGRRSCPPAAPWFLGIYPGTLDEAAGAVPMVSSDQHALEVHHLNGPEPSQVFRTITETDEPTGRAGSTYRNRSRSVTYITPPTVKTLEELLGWSQEHLR